MNRELSLLRWPRRVSVLALGGLLLLLVGCKPANDGWNNAERFVRLDADGQPLSAAESGHRCVLDRATTLWWAVPAVDAGPLAPDQTYSWYHPDKSVHLGEPGLEGGGHCLLERCDTAALVEAINQAGWCGQRDWRLPTREEAILLGKRSQGQSLGLDPRLFPALQAGELWTASTFRMYPASAWALDPATALDRADLKSVPKPVRLVRGSFVLPSRKR